jgi:hypothetical protein
MNTSPGVPGLGGGSAHGVGERKKMRRAAALVAVATVFLCVPSFASSSPFYGEPTGVAKKACLENGGVWTPYLQTCTV